MKLTRRTFFKVNAVGAATLAVPGVAAAAGRASNATRRAVLVDTTRCVGCRSCESACSESNGLPDPTAPVEGGGERPQSLAPDAYTTVKTVSMPDGEERFVKRQCMHCVEPACASACLVRALEKTAEGPVVYHGDRCLGCRYCMVACPFDVPQFEYDKAVPLVTKCSFCVERQADGEAPACIGACPTGALTFGSRAELLEEARQRIYQNPGAYVPHIYGEAEVGGTSWLYLSDRPFEQLGFRTDLGTAPAAGYAQSALSGVPTVMTVGPALLMGLYTFAQRRNEIAASAAAGRNEDHHG